MARCGQDFFMCWKGLASFSKCNEGLLFNPLTSQCDYRSNVLECEAAADVVATTAASGQASPPAFPSTTPTPDLFCEGRGDGHFGSGCQSFFYSCQNGATTKMFCPMGLHYDADSKTCDQRELIVACGGKKTQSSSSASAPAATVYVPFKPIAPAQDIPMPPVDNFCASRANGFYTEGCQQFFYSCQESKTYKITCPSDLYYDAIEKACNHREAIRACGGAAPAPTTVAPTTPAAAPKASTYVTFHPVAPVKQDVPVVTVVENFCFGKVDAFYGDGCQPLFYSCQAGVTYKMDCPAGLYYDNDAKKCDQREEIVACGGTPRTTHAPVKAADVPIVPIENFCKDKKDGFHSFGCASFFYSCQSGSTYKMTCPSGLYYDMKKMSCENKEEIAACGAAPATAQTPAAAPARTTVAPAPYAAKPVADVPVVVSPVVAAAENVCAGKTNVIIGSGCSNVFYNCHDSVAYTTTCGVGLFFDVDTKQCNYRDLIVACGGKKQEATVAPVAPALDKPVVAVENFCLTKEDGFYGVGCAEFFYTCQGGVSYKMNCPQGLFYEEVSKHCDRKEEIAACRAAPTTSTASIALAPAVTSSAYASAAATAAPSRDQQPAPLNTNENFCTGKMDGFYPDIGCVGHFLSCSNGLTAKMLCPSGLFYDVATKQCDNKEDIAICGGTAKPVAPVIVAAAPTVPPAAPVAPYVQSQQPGKPLPATAAPVRDVVPVESHEKFCVGKPDGTHTNGCDSFYYSCVNQLTYKMACPSGLFYEITTSVCDVKENVVACGGQKPVVSPVAPLAHTQPVPTVDQFCFGKADGFYGVGCAAHFFSCNQAYTYKMICPSGLFYDITVKACNNREKVAACGAVAVPLAPVLPAAPLTPAAAAPQSQYTAPVVPAAAPATPVSAFNDRFCAGKANGIYTIGCASWYYNCANGYTYKMNCGAGLFYDGPSARCEMKENVVACGGQQPRPQILPATAAPVRDVLTTNSNACTGKVDGIYTEGCSGFYNNCQNGYTYKMACPAGLFYNGPTKRCEQRENVAACGVQQPQILPAPITAAPVRDVVVAPIANFCAGKANGIYAEGCSAIYYNCANGYTYKMDCPAGLFFNGQFKRCEMKETVPACGGQQPQQPQPVPQQAQPQPQSQYGAAPTTAAPVRDVVAPISNFCSGKANGLFADGCSAIYYNCANGYTYSMDCPAGLFFNGLTKRCEMKETVTACGGQQPQQAQPQAQTYQPAPTTAAPVRDVVAPISNFCSGKANGLFADGCSAIYYNCANGYTYRMDCPAGLFFNGQFKRCEMKETVPACGGQQPQQAQPQPQTPYGQPAPTTIAPVRDTVVAAPIDNFCSGKANGIYAHGCSATYYSCANGYTNKMDCPAGLFYNGKFERCEMKETVPACGGQQPQQPQPVPQQAQPQSPYQQPSATVAPIRDVSVPSFCTGKADGKHADGCKNFFYYCTTGRAFKMECNAGLFYDATTERCERIETVVACAGQQPQQAQPQSPYQQPSATVAPIRDVPASSFCTGRVDGKHADGCKNFFYYCTTGRTFKMECNAGLFYDATTERCERKENVVACGGTAPAAAPGYDAPSATAAPAAASYSRPAAPVKDAGVTDKTCVGKEDAFFGEGCNNFYHACINGATYKMACPTGLFFDTELQSCEYRDHIPNCGGKRVEVAPTPSPALDTLPPAPVNSAQCSGKADGIYAVADCSEEYFFCQAGLMRKENCQTGLFYNEANGMCDWRDNVVKCAGARDTLPTRAPETAEYARSPSRPITAPKYDSHKEEQQKPRKPALNPSGASSCAGQADGYYASGCSADYTACVGGQSMAMHCPSDLRYSASATMCDYSDNVPECGGSTPVVAKDIAPRPTLAPVVPVAPKPTIPTEAPVKEVHPRCANRPDGIYALAPCSQNYLACVDEKANIGRCREDLFYSTESGLCDWKDKNPACTMLVRPTPLTTRSIPSTTPVPVAPVSDVVRPTGDRLIRPRVPLGYQPDCSKIADGVYAINACSPYYSRCAGGRLSAHGTCPVNTFFSATAGSCLDKSTFTACAAPPPLTPSPPTQPPALAPAQLNYGVQSAQQQQPMYQQQQPQQYGQQQQQYAPSYSATYGSDIYADPSQFCYGRADAVYGNTCQKSYVICTRGATLSYTCPRDFVFDRERVVCDHPSRIAQCGAAPSYGYTAQAPAYQQQQSYGYSAAAAPVYQHQTYANY